MLYFIHIHRTGGTTLKAIFRNNFGLKTLFINNNNRANYEYNLDEYHNLFKICKFFNYKVLESHNLRYPPTGSNNLNIKLEPITFLRDPMERFLSNYFYLQQIAGKNHYANSDFDRYVEFIKKNHPHDVRYLNGEVLQIAKEYNLEKAKSIIDQFYFVGLTEYFDQSLILLQNKIGRKYFNINYEKKNVGKVKQIKKRYYDEIKESGTYYKVKMEMNLDIELYKYVKEKLLKEIDEFDGEFNNELKKYKSLNTNYKFPLFKTKVNNLFSRIVTELLKKKYKF